MDWEAILSKHPQQFVARLADWFVPPAGCPPARVPTASDADVAKAAEGARALDALCPARKDSSSGSSSGVDYGFPDVESLPLVAEVLETHRQRLDALNGPGAPPV